MEPKRAPTIGGLLILIVTLVPATWWAMRQFDAWALARYPRPAWVVSSAAMGVSAGLLAVSGSIRIRWVQTILSGVALAIVLWGVVWPFVTYGLR